MTTDNTVSLKVDGQIYGGWTDIAIESSLTEVSSSFSVGVTERWPGEQATHSLKPGQACVLAIGGSAILTGWIDDVDVQYDAQSHGLTIRGRDKTGDLVDSSALVSGSGGWIGISVMDIAKQLLSPFGISVKSTVPDTAKIMTGHSIQMGETVWECLDRALRQYGVMAMADGAGNLVLTRPGTGGTLAEVSLGGNILAGQGTFSGRETFQDYYILGQFPGGNTTYSDPRVTTMASAHATDPNVTRYRPLIVFAECNTSSLDYLSTRAKWEAAYRSAKGRRITVTVAGWRDANGALYTPNTMIRLEDDFLGVHETLLVVSVRLTLSDQGRLAELGLARKDAFLPEPLTTLPPFENDTGAAK